MNDDGRFGFSPEILKRTAYLVLILAVVVAILTFATGEGAEDVVEKLAGIDENLIKTPQEVADKPSVDRFFYALLFQNDSIQETMGLNRATFRFGMSQGKVECRQSVLDQGIITDSPRDSDKIW